MRNPSFLEKCTFSDISIWFLQETVTRFDALYRLQYRQAYSQLIFPSLALEIGNLVLKSPIDVDTSGDDKLVLPNIVEIELKEIHVVVTEDST